jgi:3D (Asp-Asp-Asp) domain-containing protein
MDPNGLKLICTKKSILVTGYSDKGAGSDCPYFKSGDPSSVGHGIVAVANPNNPETGRPCRPARPVYPYGSSVIVYGSGEKPVYTGEVHDTGSGWDPQHHNISPDQWIDIWLPKAEAQKWGAQWREVEICYEDGCP